MKIKKNKRFSLFVTPTFLSGLSRVFDIASTINVYSDLNSPEEADFIAMQSDWSVVGEDMKISIKDF